MSKLLIVIPAHNEDANIVQVVEELTRSYPQYDYVVVNDGSRDKTAALCRAHGYRLIDLPVNLGLAGAFQTGLRFAAENDYDCAMQMDADGAAVPALAETYDISEDGKTYTFHLRDAKWSNGDAVTAADFVFGWQRAVDPANASEYSYMLSDIGQVVNAAEIIAGEKPVTDL